MSQKKINVRFSSYSAPNGMDASCNSLVRFKNDENNKCFHVELLENGDVDIYVADPALRIMDIENLEVSEGAAQEANFHDALSGSSDMTKTEKALAIVREFPYRTSQEMAQKINPSIITADSLHKRLSDLYKKNKIVKTGTRVCTVTGKEATAWAPVD